MHAYTGHREAGHAPDEPLPLRLGRRALIIIRSMTVNIINSITISMISSIIYRSIMIITTTMISSIISSTIVVIGISSI